ncbi:MAG: hypothetical protein ACI9VM_000918 [Candidatus Azotimanducaceae bacterium]|jgi:hypothetical protein
MSEKQYLKALNTEIQKLNGVIDHKIMLHSNYKREALRHKKLLSQLRRERRNRSILSTLLFGLFTRA